MPEAPDFLERLRQYEAMLDSRISELDVAMRTNLADRLADRLTISTYRVAKDYLHQVFPELK